MSDEQSSAWSAWLRESVAMPEGWIYEDELPEMTDEQYHVWFVVSRVIHGVRMGPKPTWWNVDA